MKAKYFKFIYMMMTVVMLFSCEDFIELKPPQNQLIGNTVFEDESTATAALMDVYARIRENSVISGNIDSTNLLLGLYTDDLDYYGNSPSLDNFYNHTIIPSNDAVLSLWGNSYTQIYAVNALLEGLSNSTGINVETRNRLQGEGFFIRALLHFYLTNLYGDIPYITTTDYQINSSVFRMPILNVYEQIITDLIEAKELLTNDYIGQDRVRINKAVVQTLLARVYLYQQQWSLAELEATEVINNSAYNLEPNLDEAFLKSNPSTIWQLHSGVAGANTAEGRTFIFTSGPPPITALSENFIEVFENNDMRKQNWIKSITDGVNVWYHSYKYKQNGNTSTSEEYSIIFRLEEQYLIRAEARANQSDIFGAQEDLNKIRSRAGLNDTSATSQQDLLLAILKERRTELFTESGHRWFDLKRTGQAEAILSSLKPGWQDRSYLLPIPETELILNSNLQPQNNGY